MCACRLRSWPLAGHAPAPAAPGRPQPRRPFAIMLYAVPGRSSPGRCRSEGRLAVGWQLWHWGCLLLLLLLRLLLWQPLLPPAHIAGSSKVVKVWRSSTCCCACRRTYLGRPQPCEGAQRGLLYRREHTTSGEPLLQPTLLRLYAPPSPQGLRRPRRCRPAEAIAT